MFGFVLFKSFTMKIENQWDSTKPERGAIAPSQSTKSNHKHHNTLLSNPREVI